MKIIFHVGPHKTGTTAIQNALQDNRQVFADYGIYLPYSSARIGGFHDLPWAMRGWDPRLLHPLARIHSAKDLLRRELTVAMNRQSRVALFSSEDLSLLSTVEWQWLLDQTLKLLGTSSKHKLCMTYTRRSTEELVAGAYDTLVQLGCSQPFDEVAPALKSHFKDTYGRLDALIQASPEIDCLKVDYTKSDFLPRWFSAVLPEISFEALTPSKQFFNARNPSWLLERLRVANERLGLRFDSAALFDWPPLHTVESFQAQQRQIQKLLTGG